MVALGEVRWEYDSRWTEIAPQTVSVDLNTMVIPDQKFMKLQNYTNELSYS